MSYETKIEIFRIKNAEFVSPLANAPMNQTATHNEGDFVVIIENVVWIKNRNAVSTADPDEFQQAAYSAAFVRINPSIFEKLN